MKTELLVDYMEIRSEVEEVDFDKNYISYISEQGFNKGVRSFFGVQLDNNGNLLSDTQQPYQGFFGNWETVVGWLRENHTPSDDEWDGLNCECGNCKKGKQNEIEKIEEMKGELDDTQKSLITEFCKIKDPNVVMDFDV